MKTLLVFDEKNYTAEMPVYEKFAARGVILRDGKLAVQKGKVGECKILGGGIEPGEAPEDALCREVLEESGLFVIKSTMKEIGTISEMREDIFKKGTKYVCHTTFYACEIEDRTTEPHMTQSEMEKGYHLEWIAPEEIIRINENFEHMQWIKRDTAFIRMMVEGKIEIGKYG